MPLLRRSNPETPVSKSFMTQKDYMDNEVPAGQALLKVGKKLRK
jgi:hypothetical protein